MRTISIFYTGVMVLAMSSCSQPEVPKKDASQPKAAHALPSLHRNGNRAQLTVDEKPFLILGGELGNSSFTSMEYMAPVWDKMDTMHVNTLLAPVYWELIEPTEGTFDFALYDQLITESRSHGLRLVLLWFGAWKNSMSSHVPSWIKTDQARFPRVQDDKGKSQEILTPFSDNNLEADRKAYVALMKYLNEFDAAYHTVIMVQTENEIGMLPTARDHSALADQKFSEPVPSELLQYLKTHKDALVPEFNAKWGAQGYRESGTWTEVFGNDVHTEEIFMAWYYARFTDELVRAGKEIYNLPMYVNAALNRPGWLPGEYPSAGPLPHLMDIWKAGGRSIDFLSPDIYFPNIEHWCDLYVRQDNPLFIPEAKNDNTAPAKALFTMGHYESMGFSPFSIESVEYPEAHDLGKVYDMLEQLTPLISEHHGQGAIEGVLLDKEKPEVILNFGDYVLKVRHTYTLRWEGHSEDETWDPGAAIIIRTGESEFYVAGSGITISFKLSSDPDVNVGILKNEEGRFEDGKWVVIRHLNGDQTHQGRHIRIFKGEYAIQRVALYTYN